jgi:alpha-beta hydrolase superfamily lysophospholipase
VSFPDPIGPMPTWLVGGRGSTWTVFVHGIDGNRGGGLRPLLTLHALGIPTMLISYRNDAGAPPSPDHLIHLGMTEWQDLDAAARWAKSHGARRFILYGDSMGGAIVTRFMHESSRARDVVALGLDSPVLDWRSVIDHVLSSLHLPFLGVPLRATISLRAGVDWNALDEIRQAHKFHVPILLFQGAADPLVPPDDSRRFSSAVPRLVTYVPVAHAGHIESWNVDPAAYAARLRAFLTQLIKKQLSSACAPRRRRLTRRRALPGTRRAPAPPGRRPRRESFTTTGSPSAGATR